MKVFRRSLSIAISLFSLLPVTACKSTAQSSEMLEASGPDDFVRVDPSNPSKLIYKGSEYRFSAANSYSMLNSKASADKQFAQMKELGVNALRMWGFWNGGSDSLQPSRGVFTESRWKQFDYVISKAAEEKIKIILPLANYWDEFGGIVLLNSWVGHPPESKEYFDREIFYRNDKSKKLYQEYVMQILNRRNSITGKLYKDDPTILMWEPMNEARGRSDPSGQTVVDWLTWASKLIKDNAPKQLVGTGTEGFFKSHSKYSYYPWQAANPPTARRNGRTENPVPEGSYFDLDCKIPTIDICSIHAWPFQWFIEPADRPDLFMSQWVEEHIATAKDFKKPLYLAEFGWQIQRSEGEKAMEMRAKVFEAAYFDKSKGSNQVRDGIAGIGFWNISDNDNPNPGGLTFEVTCPKDQNVCSLIKAFSKAQVLSR